MEIDKSKDLKFWAKTKLNEVTGCIEWTGAKSKYGYGNYGKDYTTVRAHRYAYELCKGFIPEGKIILHDCDNRLCVNPDHLAVGTYLENTQDMFLRGRNQDNKGVKNHGAKVNETQVYMIRALSRIETFSRLSRLFHISVASISAICQRKNWSHLPEKSFEENQNIISHYIKTSRV